MRTPPEETRAAGSAGPETEQATTGQADATEPLPGGCGDPNCNGCREGGLVDRIFPGLRDALKNAPR